jgi:hypothetical protein
MLSVLLRSRLSRFLGTTLLLVWPALGWSQTGVAPEVILINMGGPDCPPCVAWRAAELPKLRSTPVFSKIKYVHVDKAIASPVPPKFFLPELLKPYKEKLEIASAGRSGSPQVAILVNGEVYDYWWGTGKSDVALLTVRLEAILAGTPDPSARCVKFYPGRNSYEWPCINSILPATLERSENR